MISIFSGNGVNKFRTPYPFVILSSNNCRQPEIEVDTFIRSPEAALFLNMEVSALIVNVFDLKSISYESGCLKLKNIPKR
jgi:hypothetical protein